MQNQKLPVTLGFDFSTSPFPSHMPCLLRICQLTNETGWDLCSELTFENNVIFWNTKHTHKIYISRVQFGVFFGLLGINVILGGFSLTKNAFVTDAGQRWDEKHTVKSSDRKLNHLFSCLGSFHLFQLVQKHLERINKDYTTENKPLPAAEPDRQKQDNSLFHATKMLLSSIIVSCVLPLPRHPN